MHSAGVWGWFFSLGRPGMTPRLKSGASLETSFQGSSLLEAEGGGRKGTMARDGALAGRSAGTGSLCRGRGRWQAGL